MPVVNDIITALSALNGEGSLDEIFHEYTKLNRNAVKSTMRRTLQQFSSDTQSYLKKNPDYFFSVEGLGKGIWGLRLSEPIDDIVGFKESYTSGQPVSRKLSITNRIVRDTLLSRRLKELIGSSCQLCETQIRISDGLYYSEAHHIKPLGFPHNGPDKKENILILCPNCHVKCDLKLLPLNVISIKNNRQNVGKEYIDFHNHLYASAQR
jgi:predicted HNH restriction endonuclease